MNNLEEINQFAASLSVAQIENLSDEVIMSMAMERPDHSGQFGFLLSPQFFRSTEHLSKTMLALMRRLDKIENLEAKMYYSYWMPPQDS